MQDSQFQLIRVLPIDDWNLVAWQLKYVGQFCSADKLRLAGLDREPLDSDCARWDIRLPGGFSDCLRLFVTMAGELMSISFSMEDRPGGHAPEKAAYDAAEQVLQSLYEPHINGDLYEEWMSTVVRLTDPVRHRESPEGYDLDQLVHRLALMYIDAGIVRRFDKRLIFALARRFGEYDNSAQLLAIADTLSNHRFHADAALAIRRVLDLPGLTAEQWTFMGEMYTRRFRKPRAGVVCYVSAFDANPTYDRPRYAVWEAGGAFARRLLPSRNFFEMNDWADRIQACGESHENEHTDVCLGFMGMCYEGMKQMGRARQLYQKALDINPRSIVASSAMDRIDMDLPELQTEEFDIACVEMPIAMEPDLFR